jgi:hypothetical protein
MSITLGLLRGMIKMVCDKSRDGKHSVSEKDGQLLCFFCGVPYSQDWNADAPVREKTEFITLRTDTVYALHKELSECRKLMRRDNPEGHLHRIYEFKVVDDVLDSLLLKGNLDRYFDAVVKVRKDLSLKNFMKEETKEDSDE